MTPLNLNDDHADALAKGLGSEISSKTAHAEQISSTKIASD
jgi:hypothetical protein